jgi:hypothetical protein
MLMVYAKTLQVEWLNQCDSCRSICLLLVAIPKNIPVADVAVLSTVLEDDVYIFVICHSNKNACIYMSLYTRSYNCWCGHGSLSLCAA